MVFHIHELGELRSSKKAIISQDDTTFAFVPSIEGLADIDGDGKDEIIVKSRYSNFE